MLLVSLDRPILIAHESYRGEQPKVLWSGLACLAWPLVANIRNRRWETVIFFSPSDWRSGFSRQHRTLAALGMIATREAITMLVLFC